MNEFEILRELKIEITDFIETPSFLPFSIRCLLAKLAQIERQKRMSAYLVFTIKGRKDAGETV